MWKAKTGGLEPSRDGIRQWLIRRVARQLGTDPSQIDAAVSFDELGLDSIVGVKISGELERLLGRRLSPALLFDHGSIEELARYLADVVAAPLPEQADAR